MNDAIFGAIFSLTFVMYHVFQHVLYELVCVGNISQLSLKKIFAIILMSIKKMIERHFFRPNNVDRNLLFFTFTAYGLMGILVYFSSITYFSQDYIWPFLIYICIRMVALLGMKSLIQARLYLELTIVLFLIFIFISMLASGNSYHYIFTSIIALYFVGIASHREQKNNSYLESLRDISHYYVFSKIIYDSIGEQSNAHAVLVASLLTFALGAIQTFINSYGMFLAGSVVRNKGYAIPVGGIIFSTVYWVIYDNI